MKMVIDIDEEIFNKLPEAELGSNVIEDVLEAVENGISLDKIRAKIDQIEINGHIRDVECFRAGINTALNVIDKYKAGRGNV